MLLFFEATTASEAASRLETMGRNRRPRRLVRDHSEVLSAEVERIIRALAAHRGTNPAMKILVAEDNAFYRHMLVSTLTEWGYEAVAAVDGAEAWEKLRADGRPPAGDPRLDDAQDGRAGGLPESPGPAQPGADLRHHPHGEGRQGEHRHRAGRRGRRLPDQAVRPRGAAGPAPGRPADRRLADEPGGRVRLRPRRRGQEPLHPGPRRAGHRLRAGDRGAGRARPPARRRSSGRGACSTTSARSACPTPSSTSPAR